MNQAHCIHSAKTPFQAEFPYPWTGISYNHGSALLGITNHAMPNPNQPCPLLSLSPFLLFCTYAMMLTAFPSAFWAMSSANRAALASMLPEGGTEATITSMPFSESASLMPLQYCIPGRNWPASRSSSKPRRPWARIRVCFYGVVRYRWTVRERSLYRSIWPALAVH